ncbi:bifunctional 4-hydroxy-2-oxoglutarate aldolase/2-dehydro-3-deoxy-phosphogluconate aldolase [Halalkalibacter alkaliphilus]|uniref:Bifunctional 4-hydroxy-2-oxoglutarate aldolase/2-dehydro-3-deoxy-phosphogluconate aldolase n=1 Tax=Halalkalibacter alkaliphilus TaxID=2917993 RepID=A0A9X2A0T2_9BACI|nr:bifunctional 4-hydroxy-2-oxoglutarate aldolase/2-dehydro-3-deoxy-phosphogluconate aldolase [Halalkalibacter alkaliphilus]MCL7745760.1 bifunctional 4-hydroxy-2-oxoglutarate aldolase/2-dehydro-3-deoxy-phosphogluconate aldolase [Halalkalibacter alkaliphilus]
MKKWDVCKKIEEKKVIAVIRANSKKEAIEMSKAALEGGTNIIEITATTPGFLEVIDELLETEDPDLILGVGTVLDTNTARIALLKGVHFVVCPHFDKEIVELCNLYNTLIIPGATNVQQIIECLKAGCQTIKLFPGNFFESSAIKTLKGPLPQADFIPTGGISEKNMNVWLREGALAVGIGSEWNKVYKKGYKELVSYSQRLSESVDDKVRV